MWARGYGYNGRLANGSNDSRSYAAVVTHQDGSDLTGIVDVGGAWGHTLALASDGTLWAWGQNNYGQLGVGDTTARYYPAAVVDAGGNPLRDFVDVASGAYASYARTGVDAVYAWGQNPSGRLGIGTLSPENVLHPTEVRMGAKFGLSAEPFFAAPVVAPPSGLSPNAGTATSDRPTLGTTAYQAVGAGGAHAASQWRVGELPGLTDDGMLLTHSGDWISDTVTFTAPEVTSPSPLVLTLTVTDDHGLTGSDTVSVVVLPADLDGDGIDSRVEDAAPNADGTGSGDGNGDGIADREQPDVASLPSAGGGAYVTVEAPSNSGVRPLTATRALSAPDDAPSGFTFPYGVFAFTIQSVAPGGTAEVHVWVPYDPEIEDYYKRNDTGAWEPVGAQVDHLPAQAPTRTRLSFTLENGGRFDQDGDGANTSIQDPGGPVVRAAAVPTLALWPLLLMATLLAGLGTGRLRR